MVITAWSVLYSGDLPLFEYRLRLPIAVRGILDHPAQQLFTRHEALHFYRGTCYSFNITITSCSAHHRQHFNHSGTDFLSKNIGEFLVSRISPRAVNSYQYCYQH
jgi:hypothetical protein